MTGTDSPKGALGSARDSDRFPQRGSLWGRLAATDSRSWLTRAIDQGISGAERKGQHALEACADTVAITLAFDVADHDKANGIALDYGPDIVHGRVTVQRRQVVLTRSQLGQRPAPLQLVTSPAKHGRGARVGGHACRGRIFVTYAFCD